MTTPFWRSNDELTNVLTGVEIINIEDIRVRVRSTVCEFLGVTQEDLHDEDKFDDNLNADSLDRIELLMGLEEAFSIEIPDDVDPATVNCVDDVVKYIVALNVAAKGISS